MKVNVYVKPYEVKRGKKGERRFLLIIRRYGQRDESMNLGPVTRKEAEQRRIEVLHGLLNGAFPRTPLERVTLGVFCKKLFDEYFPGEQAETTLALYRDRLCKACDVLGSRYLDQIRREDVELYLNGQKWSGRTKNIMLSCIRHVFRKAVEWNYLVDSPVLRIKRWTEHSVGSRSVTEDQLSKLLVIATPWQLNTLTVQFYGGMRPGELSRLKFKDINWESRKLTLVSDRKRKTKTREERQIDMTADLEKTLHFLSDYWPNMQYGSGASGIPEYLPRKPEQMEYVFCHRDGRPIGKFQRSFRRLMKSAGIEGVTMNGVRKTFCSLLQKGRINVKVAQKLLGHSDPRLTLEIYTQVDDEQLREAVDALPSFNKLATKERLLMDGKKPSSVESVWNKSDTVH